MKGWTPSQWSHAGVPPVSKESLLLAIDFLIPSLFLWPDFPVGFVCDLHRPTFPSPGLAVGTNLYIPLSNLWNLPEFCPLLQVHLVCLFVCFPAMCDEDRSASLSAAVGDPLDYNTVLCGRN